MNRSTKRLPSYFLASELFFVTGWSAFTVQYERDLHTQFKFMLRFQRINFAPFWKSICGTCSLNQRLCPHQTHTSHSSTAQQWSFQRACSWRHK